MPFQLSAGGGLKSKLMKRACVDTNVLLRSGSWLGTAIEYYRQTDTCTITVLTSAIKTFQS